MGIVPDEFLGDLEREEPVVDCDDLLADVHLRDDGGRAVKLAVGPLAHHWARVKLLLA